MNGVGVQITSHHDFPDEQFGSLTGYRILTIVLTAGFGLTKAFLSYRGYSTIPNTLDWLYTVVVFLLLYWLGLYENHSSQELPWLFEEKLLFFSW